MKRISRFIPTLIAAIALLVAAFAPVSAALPVPASPSTANANTLNSALFSSKVLAASTNSDSIAIGEFSACGLQYAVVQGGTPNTITLNFQGSNDANTWTAYGASAQTAANVITSSTTASVSDFYIFNVPPARYARLAATVGNTQSVTVTARLFCK